MDANANLNAIANLNASMRYIEAHLLSDIDYTEMARLAGCTEHSFRRMFAYLAGIPLQEYVRRRKLSHAAELLRLNEKRIIDISLICGYESPDAFGKAFHAVYGVSPTAYRKRPFQCKAFPPLFFHLTLKGGIAMEYRVVERDAFYVMGKTGFIPLVYHGANPHTADVWKKLSQADLFVLMEHSTVDPKGVLTIYEQTTHGNAQAKREGDEVFMCVGVVMAQPMPDRFKGRFDTLPFEAATWLVFPTVDNATDRALPTTKEAYARIAEWLPTSQYEETGAPQITWSETYDFSKPDKKGEIWVPVRKRNP